MKPIALKEKIRSNQAWGVDLLRLTSVCLVFVGIGNSQAEAVYRCGNSYSRSAQCAQEAATEVNAHTEPRQHGATSNVAATQDQREADALEKKRLQSERLATQNQPARVVVVPGQNQTAPPPETPRHGQRLHRPKSPYFTAKDPNKPVKKTTKD
jgi:hypothetical protein